MRAKPVVTIVHEPEPRVLISVDGDQVDITQAVAAIDAHVDGMNDYATIQLHAVPKIDFPMEVQVVAPPSSILEGLTAEILNGVIADSGMGTSPGEAILGFLTSRLASQ